ncbi:MAG: PQQ-dependent sugar dehydrogenase, partial [Pricia sp.]
MKNTHPTQYRILVLSLFFLLSATFAIQAQLPDDFQRVDIVTGLSNATTFKFAPDGRIFIVDRYGELIVYKPDTNQQVTAGNLPVFHELEDGFLGLAFDPNFTANNYVYIHYSPLDVVKNRVSRFTMNGDNLDLGSEIILLEWDTQRDAYYHAAGDMDFDSQGNLYIATGDNSNHSEYAALNENDANQSAENTSSSTNDLRGKILRITPQPDGSYTIPPGNLFPVGTLDTRPEIYVMGARNPYRIFVDKENTDWLFWGEVGPDANDPSAEGSEGRDEINLVKEAGNYGWPYFAAENIPYQNTYSNPPFYYDPAAPVNISRWRNGLQNLPPAQPSWLDFFHRSYCSGPRYYFDNTLTDQQRLPVEFDGVYFYFDFNRSLIWAVQMDEEGNILSNEQLAPSVFPSGPDGFLDMQIGPDGFMYILAYGSGCPPCSQESPGSGKLIKVLYTGVVTNSPPVIEISADVTDGSLPLTVNFSSEGTMDPDGDSPLSYAWDFDGDTTVDSTAENPSFEY